MKLAIVTHNVCNGDGQGRVTLEIARHCLSRGWNVTLFADKIDCTLLKKGARAEPIHPAMRDPLLAKTYDFARRADRAIERMRSQFDLVVASGFSLRTQHDVNVSHFVHGAWMRVEAADSGGRGRSLYHRFASRVNARWERQAYAAAGMVAAVSAVTRQHLTQIGVPFDHTRVIHNGVDLQEFHPGHENRSSLGLPEGVPLALFAGEIRTPRKNLETILRAMQQLKSLHVAVIGDPAHSPYPKLARTLGVGDRVHFLGFRADVASLMRASDFFVFPSRHDPFGLVVLEAMASGLPIVTAITAGASDLVPPECGFVLVDPNDVQGCADAMQRLVDDPALRKSMGEQCRVIAEQHSWDTMGSSYASLFEEAEASRRQNPSALRAPATPVALSLPQAFVLAPADREQAAPEPAKLSLPHRHLASA